MLGIGAIIGTGIFVLTGVAAADYAGPALILSFIISGIACAFAALCYAELSAMIPISGSAYTFGYVGLGEIWGWLIGWDLILEYCVAVAGFFPIGKVAELTNMGTVAAFVIVSLSVIVLRKSRPDLQRPFKVPFVPVVPILAVVFCLFLILQLPTFTKMAFLVWISIGFIVYVFYGYKHSSLNEEKIKS